MIVWLNGTHGAGKTTTGALVQPLIPDSRVFDAEKVGGTLMDITPGLPETDNSPFRLKYLEPYAEAARTWLHAEAEVVDTTHLTPAQAALQIAEAVKS
ncbi:hypothetical protein [Dactylosporangium sp. CA-092794]|uniref:hypothetical protein n=1 Tax=Dactylosporangium sp. CA-092794 TaxID=3239929 RepID=UPI003D9190E2